METKAEITPEMQEAQKARLNAAIEDLGASIDRVVAERDALLAVLVEFVDCTYGKVKLELWQRANRLVKS